MLDPNNKPIALANPDAVAGRGALIVPSGPPQFLSDGPSLPPALAGGPTLSDLFHALRRRWVLAFSLAALAACGVVFAVLNFMPAKFVGVARVQISSREAVAVFEDASREEDFLAYKSFVVAQMKSTMVVSTALASDEVKKAVGPGGPSVDRVQTDLKADYKGPGILEVKFASDRPQDVAPIVNAICRTCITKMTEAQASVRAQRARDIEKNMDTRRKLLQQDVRNLRRMESDAKMDDWNSSKQAYASVQDKVSAVEKPLLSNRLEQNKYRQMLGSVDGKQASTVLLMERDIDEALTKDFLGASLITKIAKIDEDIATYRQTVLPPALDELIRKADGQKAALQKQLDVQRVKLRKDLQEKMAATARESIEALLKEETYLQAEYVKLKDESNKVNPWKRPEHMINLAKRIEEEESALAKLNEKVTAFKLEPTPAARIALLQEAEEPTVRDFSKHYKIAGAGGVGVFGLFLFGVAWLEFRSRRINTAEEVSRGLGINLVGTLPNLPARARKANPASPRDQLLQNQLTEAVDSIRTMLLHSARTDKLSIVMITSAMPGEGKTSLATQLAASLARAWRKTLLIDGDMRNPAGHKLFDLPLDPGFSEVLRGEVSVADAVKPTPISRLWLMPAGNYDSHALEALAQEGIQATFEQLKQQYDFIIVDSCPVLPVADSLNLAQHVDGVLFAVLRDVSRSPAVFAAQQRLNNLGVRTLGAVVIGEKAAAGSVYQYPVRSA